MLLYDREERLIDNLRLNYINRSRVYLWPSVSLLKSREELFDKQILKEIVCTACGIEEVEGLCLIFDSEHHYKILGLIAALKTNGEYLKDMVITDKLHAVVIKVPIDLGAFIKGYYSKIYTDKQKRICFHPEIHKSGFPVVFQDPSYFPIFFDFMKANFEVKGSEHIPPNMEESLLESYTEWDIPPCLNQEIIFYKPN